jgi:hypothetical protein
MLQAAWFNGYAENAMLCKVEFLRIFLDSGIGNTDINKNKAGIS